ncbi:hypothetical protein [Vibrio breoganii]|uniref:hypothetical protein n=1 Tax=Vibrio breoganii TaxID=553239 RepID=UPI000C84B0A6|nr:hypothetical protein [Vibrio breoganii]PMM42523.1 hypothetical protein BCT52_14460 [Vibrio breoganii]
MDKSEIAIYISTGSLAVSALSFVFAVRLSKLNRKLEKIRAYDKVYHDASDLLLYNYKNKLDKPFESDDIHLQTAVNELSNSHWLEQTYGGNITYPPNVKTDREKADFGSKVSEAYNEYENLKYEDSNGEFVNDQSPVFYLDDEVFSERFKRLIEHVTNNLSYFSPEIKASWEKMRLLKPESVKNEYLALKRVNENSCEPIDETVQDPYLEMLLSIRSEYRQLNKTLNDRVSDYWFKISSYPDLTIYRLKRKFNSN